MLSQSLKAAIRSTIKAGDNHPLLVIDRLGTERFSQLAKSNGVTLMTVLTEVDRYIKTLRGKNEQ